MLLKSKFLMLELVHRKRQHIVSPCDIVRVFSKYCLFISRFKCRLLMPVYIYTFQFVVNCLFICLQATVMSNWHHQFSDFTTRAVPSLWPLLSRRQWALLYDNFLTVFLVMVQMSGPQEVLKVHFIMRHKGCEQQTDGSYFDHTSTHFERQINRNSSF